MKKLFLLLLICLCAPGLMLAQVYETGTVVNQQPNATAWFEVSLNNTYTHPPVVIAGPLSGFDNHPAQVRIRNVTTTSFEYQIEEFEYLDGAHPEEMFSYLAIERGRHLVNGKVWEAGVVPSAMDGSFITVPFTAPAFSSIPVVFQQLASDNDPVAGILRNRGITTNAFKVSIAEEKGSTNTSRTASDDIHYLAIEVGSGVLGSGANQRAYTVGTLTTDHQGQQISFNHTSPAVFSNAQAPTGGDPVFMGYDNLTASGMKLQLMEELSDGLTAFTHVAEGVGYLILDGNPIDYRPLWAEYFTGVTGAQKDEGITAWSTNNTALGNDGDNYFQVRPDPVLLTDLLVAKNTDGEVEWKSEPIAISGYTDVKLSAYIRGDGPPTMDGHLQLYYRVDNGPLTPWLNGLQRSRFDPTYAMADGINGNTLELIIRARNTTDDDYYKIDNIRVYTEPTERHAITNGDWNDGNTWSYTPGGPSCACVPDLLSDTYIDGHTVTIPQHSNTGNLTVNGGGRVLWTATKNLRFWGDAQLNVEPGGELTEQGGEAYVSFNQWNEQETHDATETPAALGYPGVNATINVNQPAGFSISGLQFNAAGDFNIQGTGNIQTTYDLDVAHQANITNNLDGNLIIGGDLSMDFPGASFTNEENIQVTDELRLRGEDIIFTNNGAVETKNLLLNAPRTTFNNNADLTVNFNLVLASINNTLFNSATGNTEVETGTLQIGNVSEVINEGSLETSDLATHGSSPGGGLVINRQIFNVRNSIFENGKSLTIHNYASFDVDGVVSFGFYDDLEIYNFQDANLYFGGSVSPNIKLYASETNNTVHYDGSGNQTIVLPQDAYWHLTLSNENKDINNPTNSSKSFAASVVDVDINGNVTIVGTSSILGTSAGNTILTAETGKSLSVAGNWVKEQINADDAYFTSGEANETVSIDGVVDQSIDNDVFNNLVITNNGGKVDMPFGVRTKGQVSFIDGIAEIGSGAFTFKPNSTVVTVSDDSHVRGLVRKNGDVDFTFPVGDGTHYRPIGVSSLSAPSTITVEYFNAAPPNAAARPARMSNIGTCGYWEVSSSEASSEGKVTLHWDADCPVDFDRVAIARWNGSQWEAVPGTATGSNAIGSITTDASTNEFGRFALTELAVLAIANDDVATTQEDVPVSVDVLANDGGEFNVTSVRIVQQPEHGTLTVDPLTGVVTYAPNTDYHAPPNDLFTYTVKNNSGIESDPATVAVTVTPVNDAPQAADDEGTTNFNTALEGESVLLNDTDVEDNELTGSLVDGPTRGTLSLRSDGTYTYVPNDGFTGTDGFTYQACDDGTPIACATATVTLTVRPFNFAPQAQDDNFTVAEDQTLPGQLISNDADANPGDVLTVDTDPVVSPRHGSIVLQSNGSFVYVAEANFFGLDSLTYRVCDNGSPVLCDTARVLIEVTPVNDAPVAVDDVFEGSEGKEIYGEVLTNDYDIEGDILTNSIVVNRPISGELNLNADGSFVYTPEPGFVGEDQFSYRVCDGQEPIRCSEATVTLIVRAGPLLIPKGISPNNDGTGDQWIIQGIQAYPGALVTVFNRWGSMVFQAMGYDNRQVVWQGNSNRGVRLGSNQLPEGTYFYVIDLGEGQKPMSGYVLLKR